MRKLILVVTALAAALVSPRTGAIADDHEWCRLARAEGGRDCSFRTFAQCAASTERLNGGGCVQNPSYTGGAPAMTPGTERSRVRQYYLSPGSPGR